MFVSQTCQTRCVCTYFRTGLSCRKSSLPDGRAPVESSELNAKTCKLEFFERDLVLVLCGNVCVMDGREASVRLTGRVSLG